MRVLDWEAGALCWNCLRNVDGDEPTALTKVRQKYFDEFLKKDLHFFLETTQQWHQVAPNPWVILGVFPIPPQHQLGLFGWAGRLAMLLRLGGAEPCGIECALNACGAAENRCTLATVGKVCPPLTVELALDA